MLVAVTVGPPAPPVVPFWPRALTAAKPVGEVSARALDVCAVALPLPAGTSVAPSNRASARAGMPRAVRNGRFLADVFGNDAVLRFLECMSALSRQEMHPARRMRGGVNAEARAGRKRFPRFPEC
ncbi:hypothetical protein GCM10010307_29790 [Streptomyces vastus]|uniref:Uncharacterized protein n=1 Tax=Streptomyces vastus TaxID=285451 RepID=A0ABN3QTD3_9ACTN